VPQVEEGFKDNSQKEGRAHLFRCAAKVKKGLSVGSGGAVRTPPPYLSLLLRASPEQKGFACVEAG
jgi:hypothetical protein